MRWTHWQGAAGIISFSLSEGKYSYSFRNNCGALKLMGPIIAILLLRLYALYHGSRGVIASLTATWAGAMISAAVVIGTSLAAGKSEWRLSHVVALCYPF